ncbi:flagellar hook-associated protein 2 [Nitrosomonas cryotolerans]|uniref:Flagellar hook-associated protein 2 n=1 Tax=Nitrosomonas cryotolerans ATCC 49181 TaxID=1131553 RepID=A0A1N6I6E2_9PROT|nr:flagellar filament capping protein FliD [Nitrosomonas cryotolerans]SFP91267.1 flagellar hook-associated protein 2 [Nitrosomonas cryotolerans]SIO27574.1 flagellar hook-associated protein 2 [Nitrosomonas cryotolerans ATCC 49181]
MLSSPGIGSGLDVNSIVSQLMTVERQPLAALNQKEAKQQAQLSAFGSLKGALSSFQSSLSSLTDPAKFSTISANLADSSVATVITSSNAVAGRHDVEVQSLAQAHKVKSGNFASTNTTLGSGTITIQFGTYSGGTFSLNPDRPAQSITIAPNESSLTGVRNAINLADAGVSASIVNDGAGDRLVIASKHPGLSNALKISTVDDDNNHTDNAGLSQLVYDASSGGTMNLTETVAASNATLIVDGISISKASNTINDAIEGITFNLLKPNTGNTTTLNITHDTAGTQAAVSSFVKAFNDLDKIITDLSKYDASTKRASILTGDATVRSIQSQLRSTLNDPLSTAGGGLTLLSEIGVSFQNNGTLKLDSDKLKAVLKDSTKDISTLFASMGKPSDSLVSFVSATPDTKNGRYALNVSQMATQGAAVGSTPAALTINAGSNDTLDLTLDNVEASITLAAGTYNATTLAAEIQSKINGHSAFSAAGSNVTVTQSAGILSISSNRYGSASIVTITGGTGQSDLLGTPTETHGLDIAGTLGNTAATGSGQVLTGAGNSSGLVLEIKAGTTGARGTVDFSHGFASRLNKLVGSLLENDSLIDSRMDGINSSIKDITTRRESLNQRLNGVEKRIRTQFAALDTMISNMTQTSNFLQQQLANLPSIGN